MRRSFVVRALGDSELAKAFPLVHSRLPAVSLEGWIEYTRRFGTRGRQPGGIMSALDEQGYIYGLFCYRIDTDLEHGRTLVIEHPTALDIVDREGAVGALVGAIEPLAERHRCAHIDVHLMERRNVVPEAHGPFFGALRAQGAEVRGVKLGKPVKPAAR